LILQGDNYLSLGILVQHLVIGVNKGPLDSVRVLITLKVGDKVNMSLKTMFVHLFEAPKIDLLFSNLNNQTNNLDLYSIQIRILIPSATHKGI
jgi:hypothetical protein